VARRPGGPGECAGHRTVVPTWPSTSAQQLVPGCIERKCPGYWAEAIPSATPSWPVSASDCPPGTIIALIGPASPVTWRKPSSGGHLRSPDRAADPTMERGLVRHAVDYVRDPAAELPPAAWRLLPAVPTHSAFGHDADPRSLKNITPAWPGASGPQLSSPPLTPAPPRPFAPASSGALPGTPPPAAPWPCPPLGPPGPRPRLVIGLSVPPPWETRPSKALWYSRLRRTHLRRS